MGECIYIIVLVCIFKWLGIPNLLTFGVFGTYAFIRLSM